MVKDFAFSRRRPEFESRQGHHTFLTRLMGTTFIQISYKFTKRGRCMKIDHYKHEIQYFNWKAKAKESINGLSKINSQLIVQYILDMENGLNVSSTNKKGSRSNCFIFINYFNRISLFVKKFNNSCSSRIT